MRQKEEEEKEDLKQKEKIWKNITNRAGWDAIKDLKIVQISQNKDTKLSIAFFIKLNFELILYL